jgi:Fic family protein
VAGTSRAVVLIFGLFVAPKQLHWIQIVAEADRTGSVLQVHDLMRTRPFLTATAAASQSGLPMATVNAALAQLQALGLVEEVTGSKRGCVYAYRAHLDILS